jgi:predicted RNase H-like HicB family nuclease
MGTGERSEILALVKYTVILEPEEGGGYHVYCPALPGCSTFGATTEKALTNIRDAIEGYIASLKKAGEPIPSDDVLVRPVEVAA